MAQVLPDRTPPARASLFRRIVADHWELWLVLALTAFAAFLRLWHLTTLPYGFHGDEANVSLDAERIAKHGWVGPWSDLSLGYPIAINYWIAAFVKFMDVGVLSVRLPIAILGTLTTPLAYLVIRNVAGWRAGVCGTVLFTVSLWHLHLSRMGIPVIGWPAMEFAVLLCLQMGTRSRHKGWFVFAGLLTGVGLWIYNSTFIFAFAVGAYLAGWFLVTVVRDRPQAAKTLLLLAIFAVSALFAGKPMIDYIRQPKSNYSARFDQVYVFSAERHDRCILVAPEKRDRNCQLAATESFSARTRVVGTQLKQLYTRLVITGAADSIDGLGARPPLGKVTAYLAIVGVVIALVRYRTRESVIIGVIAVPLLAVATALTFEGQYRRALGMLPFIALFGGIALGAVWDWAASRKWWIHLPTFALVAGSLGYAAYTSLNFYFGDFQQAPNTRFVYSPDARAAWEYLDTRSHPYVYFWNQRGSLNYETRVVLARGIAGGEDRSLQFTTEDKTQPLRYDLKPSLQPVQPLTREPDGAVFLFLGTYVNEVGRAMDKYPGGQLSEKYNDHFKTYDYRAYYLPKDLFDRYLAQENVTFPPVAAVTR